MKQINNFSSSIHEVLRELIEAKSKRDKVKFTSYQLASALAMPRSIITKLIHSDESKRVNNPKIETLIKIVDFFRKDGFNISIDDLLKTRSVDIQSQPLSSHSFTHSVMLYSFTDITKKIGIIDVTIPHTTKDLIALQTTRTIKPFFKQGSIFIIDSGTKPTNETLIAIQLDNKKEIHIKKYMIKNNKIILHSLDNESSIILLPTRTCTILGVIVQINAMI